MSNLVHRCPCENFELRHPYVVKACIYIHTHIYMYIYAVQQDNFSSISEHRIKYITERTFDKNAILTLTLSKLLTRRRDLQVTPLNNSKEK